MCFKVIAIVGDGFPPSRVRSGAPTRANSSIMRPVGVCGLRNGCPANDKIAIADYKYTNFSGQTTVQIKKIARRGRFFVKFPHAACVRRMPAARPCGRYAGGRRSAFSRGPAGRIRGSLRRLCFRFGDPVERVGEGFGEGLQHRADPFGIGTVAAAVRDGPDLQAGRLHRLAHGEERRALPFGDERFVGRSVRRGTARGTVLCGRLCGGRRGVRCGAAGGFRSAAGRGDRFGQSGLGPRRGILPRTALHARRDDLHHAAGRDPVVARRGRAGQDDQVRLFGPDGPYRARGHLRGVGSRDEDGLPGLGEQKRRGRLDVGEQDDDSHAGLLRICRPWPPARPPSQILLIPIYFFYCHNYYSFSTVLLLLL